MSLLHDFSDPATVEDDTAFWFDFYQRAPVEADLARVRLLRSKMSERGVSDDNSTGLYLKILWRVQETSTAKTPEERITIAARHLKEDVAWAADSWEKLTDALPRTK